MEAVPAAITLRITGGLIAHYRDRGNVRIELCKIGGESRTGERDTLVAQDCSVPPDGNEHRVEMPVQQPGLYKLTLDDGMDRTLVKWDCRLPLTIKSTLTEPMNKTYDQWQLYFYVPKETKTIGLFGGEHGEVRDFAGHPVFWSTAASPTTTISTCQMGRMENYGACVTFAVRWRCSPSHPIWPRLPPACCCLPRSSPDRGK